VSVQELKLELKSNNSEDGGYVNDKESINRQGYQSGSPGDIQTIWKSTTSRSPSPTSKCRRPILIIPQMVNSLPCKRNPIHGNAMGFVRTEWHSHKCGGIRTDVGIIIN
jgi:hypothetical protein